ncbi:capsule polysaccharide biosynthesis protein [Gillisia limnaea]|uniref:Capsule polysaccharide biosynthesis protein n=1 Tax=Gillisia limnaea (strain DSM 15749 / LMG 21470 / R-8282) TaxID=865937 RepID=H2BS77_GILLR|nr:capsule polysaccharide biosynthesis protein [Gillisia limnaea]EHQ01400.1 Capsule polysaccharide biosynthesis protein [Gillisia limnaea DSM 15749]
MNVLIFSSFHQSSHFLGLNLEVLQKNIDAGNSVSFIDCYGSFDSCGFNPFKLKYMCEICKFRENKGLNLIDGNYNRKSLSQIITEEDHVTAQKFIDSLSYLDKEILFENFSVGEAVSSSYISKTREREFKSKEDQKLLKELAYNSILNYLSIRRFINTNSIDKIFVLNGRWEYYRAALAAGRAENIEVEVFENFRSGGYAEIFGNFLPHDILNKKKLIDNEWDNNNDIKEKRRVSDEFFIKRKEGIVVSDKAYTLDQTQGKLPKLYDPNKKTFVLYNSSDDEFAAVGKQFDNPFFRDQLEGILYLVKYFETKNNYQLIIRMHPNLKGLIKDFLIPLYELEGKYESIILIKPEDDVDTYELMNVADTVISFGSTAGLEASYWGKPVILLGKCFYYYSDVAYVPNSIDEIPNLIESNLAPLEKDNSRKFGYYILRGGTKTKYYYNTPDKKTYFKNVLLNKLPLYFTFKYKLLKFLNIKN